ncbi:MAG: FAD-binding oxidoreductase [Acidobacteriota bacterium]
MIRARAPHGSASALVLEQSAERLSAHLEDAAHYPGGHAQSFARPSTEKDVAALLTASSIVLPIGAQSSLTGGATPHGGLILSLERFTEITPIDTDHVRVGAGVPLMVLQESLAHAHRWYPPVPTFTGAWVGGVIATNAAGAATFKYGATRKWVDGLTVVLACGCVLDLQRGEAITDRGIGWTIACEHGERAVMPGSYRMPAVAKVSAGYFAADAIDLIDLFIGAEGTLGVITSAVLRTLPEPPAFAMALVTTTSEAAALALTSDLRDAAQETWRSRDAQGIDVSAIEHMDRRCIDIVREDGADRRNDIALPGDSDVVLFVHLELPRGASAASLFDEVSRALGPDAIDTPMARLCRLLDRHGVLDRTELAMPGDKPRLDQFLALREAAPTGVNRRVGDAKRDVDTRIEKTAADMVVPFGRLAEMMRIYRDGYRRRSLDCAIWGHISDGNLHPNVLPRSFADVAAGKDAILEFGREAERLGGCPLAEHGVGRNATKQLLLQQMYGAGGVAEMRAIKKTLDPAGILAPGVLFP